MSRIGEVVADRYEITGILGEGGMGCVYRARQKGLNREVALKVIRHDRRGAALARDRFEREAKVTAALRHPGVVQIYDYGEVDGELYLAMEMLNGSALRSKVDFDLPPLGIQRSIDVAIQIAEVLDAASRVPLVHRDLKPENVIFDRPSSGEERVVLVDFGLAFLAESGEEALGRVTREGAVSGTPDYMSPEQCVGAPTIGPQSDVYALGCILYEMLTANAPFTGGPAILLSRHLYVVPPRMRSRFPELEIPGAIDDLVANMLAKKPEERPRASRVVDRLRDLDVDAPERMSGRQSDAPRTGRAARMISMGGTADFDGAIRPAETDATVCWVGTFDPVVSEHMAMIGLSVVPEGTTGDVIFAPGVTAERVSQLHGAPVVTSAARGDLERVTQLLRAGAADVVLEPLNPIDLARKLKRAAKKNKKKSPS